MVFTLTDNEELYAQYPRHFVFQICYRLAENTIQITFKVENRDEKTMYFGLGGHPGFCVPMEEGDSFTDYRLRFAPCKPKRVDFTEKCFITGTTSEFPLAEDQFLPLSHALFDDDAVVLTDMSREVTLEKVGGKHSVKVEFPQMPYVGLWHTTKSDAPFVCIEPWCSLPSKQDEIAELEKQIADIEAAIAQLEQEQKDMEALLADIAHQTAENFQRYEHIKREMEQRLYEWEILSEEE